MDLITTHQNADLDGLASMVAVARLCAPAASAPGAPPAEPLVLALPGGMEADTHRFWREHAAELPPLLAQAALRQALQGPLGRLLVVDTSNATRLGVIGENVGRFAQVRAWDTHPPSPDDLPREPMLAAGACTSVLVHALAAAGITPTPVEAGLFLLGIHQDTGHFTFAATSSVDHEAAVQCCRWGAPLDWPGRYVPKGFTRAQLALLETMARHVEMIDDGVSQVALMALELADYEPNLAVLVEQLREAEQWRAALAVVSYGERAFCIARSRGHLDVGAVMRAIGGGGHADAASAVLRGVTLSDAVQLVRQTVRDFMGQQVTAGQLAARPVFAMAATTPIHEVTDALHKRRINCVPLTRGRGKTLRYIGMATRQDVDAAMRHGLGARPVIEISGHAPTWIPPGTPLAKLRHELVAGPRRVLLVGIPPHADGVLTRGLVLRASVDDTDPSPSRRAPQAHVVLAMARKHFGVMWPIFENIAALASERGMASYLVGGTVRDLFLGAGGRDFDIVVEGDATKLARAAARKFGGEAYVSEGFGTAIWETAAGAAIDFASARSEYYEAPGALPKVEHASLNQDLFRRDFTVNAMALALSGPAPGKVHDPYGGYADLKAGVLRVLHGLSFHDDPTRALRAVRFAARFDFALAPDTQGLLKAAVRAGVMERLSQERLGAELELLLNEREVVHGFRLLSQWNLSVVIHPELAAGRSLVDRLSEAQKARLRLESVMAELPSQADVLWLVIASGLPVPLRPSRSRLVGGGKERRQRWLKGPERVAAALQELQHDVATWTRALANLDAAERVVVFAQAPNDRDRDNMLWWERSGRHIRSAINGDTLRELGFREGPRFKHALTAALDAARKGGDAAAQLQAARNVLTLP